MRKNINNALVIGMSMMGFMEQECFGMDFGYSHPERVLSPGEGINNKCRDSKSRNKKKTIKKSRRNNRKR